MTVSQNRPYHADEQVTVWHGDCRQVVAGFDPASVDAIVTDPPYELGFMGRSWDSSGVAFDPDTWAAMLRVAKPGAHLLAFGGSRTFHRIAVAIEDAGWQIRDTLSWLYGSGFPKSLDVSKAVRNRSGVSYRRDEEAEEWNGWGTALKPAWEPIILARKPLDGTVAGTVLEHGTGALNIDGCRIGLAGGTKGANAGPRGSVYGDGLNGDRGTPVPGLGRWPPNVVLDDHAAATLDAQSGVLTSGARSEGVRKGLGYNGAQGDGGPALPGSSGGASRFFYCAKAPGSEKPWQTGQVGKERCATCGGWEYGNPACGCDEPVWERNDDDTTHPTVKPLDLMRWLVRLVTPPGGTVLDPFAGTGTTGEAAIIEGFRSTLIEQEAGYLDLIVQRLTKPIQPTLVVGE